tara:strand:- start:182 stop:328 length:147 start_codon:yes stop_codon:yes gene_type:complete
LLVVEVVEVTKLLHLQALVWVVVLFNLKMDHGQVQVGVVLLDGVVMVV